MRGWTREPKETGRERPHLAAKGYRLHTITTASAKSSGFGGGDRIQATMVSEKLR
jgi:hypothetical protein